MRTIVEESPKNIAVMDVFSKLIQDRIIFIDGPITPDLANGIIAQMLYLDAQDGKKTIKVYINGPGGSIVDGLAIYDVSQIIAAPIKTVGIGMAASMNAILMLMGEERCGLPHTRFMLHQASGGAIGTTEEIGINYEEMKTLQDQIYKILERETSIPDMENFLKNDRWFGSEKAKEYGLITKIL